MQSFNGFATAMEAFQSAFAAEEAYDRDIWVPVNAVFGAGGSRNPHRVEAEMERLIEVRRGLENELIATPSPTLTEAIWKIEYARRRWPDCNWPDDWWSSIISDLRCLDTSAA